MGIILCGSFLKFWLGEHEDEEELLADIENSGNVRWDSCISQLISQLIGIVTLRTKE